MVLMIGLRYSMIDWIGKLNSWEKEGYLVLSPYRRLITMTKSKIVMVWGSKEILSSSIELFLAAKDDWKVVCLSNKEELDALLLNVENTQQDFVIIHEGFCDKSDSFPLRLLMEHPAIQVIMISLEDNLMEVYSKERIMVKQASDLIKVIDNKPELNYQDSDVVRY